MDEAVGEELNEIDAPGRSHTQGKQNDYMLKPGGSSVEGSNQISTPREGFHNERSNHLLTDILDGKNLDSIGSLEHDSSSLYCMDEVAELTLRNYNGENLAVVGRSNNRDRLQSPQNQRQYLHQITGGSSSGSQGEAVRNEAIGIELEDFKHLCSSSVLNQDQKISCESHKPKVGNFSDSDDRDVLSFDASAINRTKIISKSGFSEYFIKSALKGKGVIHRGPVHLRAGDLAHSRFVNARIEDSNAPVASTREVAKPPFHRIDGTLPCFSAHSHHDGVILRDWLENGQNKVNKAQSLLIFTRIVELVDISHSQGVALKDLLPSRFKLLYSNQVLYLGSSFRADLSNIVFDQTVSKLMHDRNDIRLSEQDLLLSISHGVKRQKFDDSSTRNRRWTGYPFSADFKSASLGVFNADGDSGPEYRGVSSEKLLGFKFQNVSCIPQASDVSPDLLTLEEKWYTTPERLGQNCSALSSNIYSLGVLFFELLGSFNSRQSREAAMLDLQHRILPPDFLSENPKEAGFCLWLLHPEPSSRPLTREILQSEVLTGIHKLVGDASLSSIDEEDAETELLLHFLSSLREKSERDALKLAEELRCIEADIQEVERRRMKKSPELSSLLGSFVSRETRLLASTSSEVDNKLPSPSDEKLRRNIRQLESAYFTMRSNIQLPESGMRRRSDQDLLRIRESRLSKKDEPDNDRFGGFFSDLCKYARYSEFKVQGILRHGDFSNLSNLICSLSFDQDEDYLAAAGVSKKIKIFDFNTLFDHAVDIHYPVIEMSNKSRLSCVCWNSYIRNYLASTDYDGVVKLWDAATGQGICEFIEHDQRAWCVDFSRVHPTKLASGSDDRMVKIWSINEKNSLCSIGNNANVCCVQFSAYSSYLLAFSSADFKTYCYDLRNVSTPWCILAGHEKAVSYAKFLDSETLVSASIDNTLKIWDLKKTNPNALSRDACVSTLRGHTNEKNFVGLSVADGYIACGSETNEVFSYFRSLPMPITSHKFGSIDPISGKDTDDDNGHFVSSVCWRRKSDMVVAANSTGCIKLLQMV